ncbi:hypothetical protein BGZ93_006786 [Podila epicladia]|nr:hypothetical protein BGZ92_001182 [Podila epicladia]KAG0094776.1 hypothetical protein BGZ93_006786 [Podila epicladia]
MTSLHIKLNHTYLVVPQHPVPTPSSSSPPSTFGASSSGSTALLKGKVVVSLSKPTKVCSLSITLSGATHLANLGPAGKRAHYSRQHLRVQHFILAPHSDPTHYYTLVQQNNLLDSSVALFSDTIPSSSHLSSPTHIQSTLQLPVIPLPRRSQDHSSGESLSFEFEIPVPNQIPTSVMTPQGGTIYRLTASMTMASKKKSMASATGLLSLLTTGPGQVSDSLTVQIYRAVSARPCSGPSVNDPGQDEVGDITPYSVSKVWPDQLDAKATIAYTQLPTKSNPDIKVQVQSLGEKPLNIHSFQAVLWERAIYRVQKTSHVAPQTENATSSEPPMVTIGVRNRIICTQSSKKPWLPDTSRTHGRHTALANTYPFVTPNPVRGSKELYSVRNCNPSTFGGTCRRGCCGSVQEDVSIQDSEFGDISIEIQHFLTCFIVVQGVAPNSSGSSSGPIPSNRLMEWAIGDIPVVLRGVPNGAEVDATGLPTYMGSFSTSVLSLADTLAYESGRVSRNSGHLLSGGDSEGGGDVGEDGSWRGARRSSWASQVHSDLDDDDDAYSAVIGGSIADSGLYVLPGYEESIGRRSAEVSL